jgi:hypothetical protein
VRSAATNKVKEFNASNDKQLKYINHYRFNIPLYVLWVRICNSKVSTQVGQAQRVVGSTSIGVVLHIELCMVRQMIDFHIVAHAQQLTQGVFWLAGLHVE